MNPEQWLSLKWNGGSTMSDRWLNQSKIIQSILPDDLYILCKVPASTAALCPWPGLQPADYTSHQKILLQHPHMSLASVSEKHRKAYGKYY